MPRQRKNHYDTFVKSKIQKAYYYFTKHEISFDSRDIFKDFDVSERSSYEMIQNEASFRIRNRVKKIDTRERKSKVTKEQIRKTNRLLQTDDLEKKTFT